MALRYFVNGTTTNSWNSTSNWSTTSGGATGSTVPSASDDVIFDVNSPSGFVDASGAIRVCLSLAITGYTNTLTMNGILRVAGGNVTFGSGIRPIEGNGTFRFDGGTITSNGNAIPNLSCSVSGITITFVDPLTINNMLVCAGNNILITLNGSNITVKGGIFISTLSNTALPTVQGTTIINLQNYNGLYTLIGTLSNTLNIQKPTRGY